MRFMTTSVVACFLVIGLALLSIGSVQQPPRQPMDPLIQEVRQLRVALDYCFRVSTQIAVTTQRANAVQVRITSLSGELADVRLQLARSSADVAPSIELVKAKDAQSSTGVTSDYDMTPQYVAAKRQIDAHREMEQQLRMRESQLSGALAIEQGKWNELSQRLDALESSIGAQRQ